MTGNATDHAIISHMPGTISAMKAPISPSTSRIVSHSVAPARPAAKRSDSRTSVVSPR